MAKMLGHIIKKYKRERRQHNSHFNENIVWKCCWKFGKLIRFVEGSDVLHFFFINRETFSVTCKVYVSQYK